MINTLVDIISDHIVFRKQLVKLAKSDIVKTYRGAALGWSWALIRPAVTIFVLWFAFSAGIRGRQPMDGFPFFLWLIAGMIPWFYMRDMISQGAGSIRKYKFLVLKIKYPVSTIPTIISIANIAVNICLQLAMICIFALKGYKPTIYYLQIPLIILLMFIFFTAWSLFSAMLSAMSHDFLELVKAMINAVFWLSGVVYNPDKIHNHIIHGIMMFNPVTLVCKWYRNAMLYQRWVWQDFYALRNYTIVTVIMIICALWAYKKLIKDIPDVL